MNLRSLFCVFVLVFREYIFGSIRLTYRFGLFNIFNETFWIFESEDCVTGYFI